VEVSHLDANISTIDIGFLLLKEDVFLVNNEYIFSDSVCIFDYSIIQVQSCIWSIVLVFHCLTGNDGAQNSAEKLIKEHCLLLEMALNCS
jgi:hypothetical protein